MALLAGDVDALIQAAGQGTRLGLGPKAFVLLDGQTLLQRAVVTMSAVAARVIVAVAGNDVDQATQLVGAPNVSIIAGGDRRSDTFRKLIAKSTAPWLLLHDIAHPFVSIELARQVLALAEITQCAAAAVPNADFLYGHDGQIRALPGEVMIVQKPIAFQKQAATAALGLIGDEVAEDLGVLEVLARAGVKASFVPGYASNYKITTSDDLTLAFALLTSERQRGASVSIGREQV
jgi:2-C-methyl-D-erythritol 4-phosphate cytidylyltransferase